MGGRRWEHGSLGAPKWARWHAFLSRPRALAVAPAALPEERAWGWRLRAAPAALAAHSALLTPASLASPPLLPPSDTPLATPCPPCGADPQAGQGRQGRQACEQGPVHLQVVPPGGLCDPGAPQPHLVEMGGPLPGGGGGGAGAGPPSRRGGLQHGRRRRRGRGWSPGPAGHPGAVRSQPHLVDPGWTAWRRGGPRGCAVAALWASGAGTGTVSTPSPRRWSSRSCHGGGQAARADSGRQRTAVPPPPRGARAEAAAGARVGCAAAGWSGTGGQAAGGIHLQQEGPGPPSLSGLVAEQRGSQATSCSARPSCGQAGHILPPRWSCCPAPPRDTLGEL